MQQKKADGWLAEAEGLEEDWLQRGSGGVLGGVMKLFYILIGMLVTQLWTFVKPCWIVRLKLPLNTANIKKN